MNPFVLITGLQAGDGRPEWELVAILRRRGIVGRLVGTEAEVRDLAGERALVMNWTRRIGPEVIGRNPVLLNLHNSLLPRYRGRHAFAWAIIHGERRVGWTLHAIDATIDTGPIYAQRGFPVCPDADINDVMARGHAVVRAWLPGVLERFDAGLLTPTPQDERLGSYYRARTDGDGRIEWHRPGRAIRDLVRAIRPPYTAGAFFELEGTVFRVDRCLLEGGAAGRPPGLVLDTDCEGNTVCVACRDGAVRLVLASPPGAPTARDVRRLTLLG